MKKEKGFTLTELTITIALVGIVSAVTLVSFQSGKKNTDIEIAAKEVVAAIRSVQNDALSGKKAVTGCNYIFNYSSGSYQIQGCNPQDSISLKNGVSFSSESHFSFMAPYGQIIKNDDATKLAVNENIKLTVTKGADVYTVCIYGSGEIKDKKGDVSC